MNYIKWILYRYRVFRFIPLERIPVCLVRYLLSKITWPRFLTGFIFISAFFLLLGCASMSDFKEVKIAEHDLLLYAKEYKIQQPFKSPIAGEKLNYKIYWTGIPAGEAILYVNEIMTYKGKKIYKITCDIHSNKFFSLIYKVDDRFHSYVDEENLFSLGYTIEREGRNKESESVAYDYDILKAEIHENGYEKIMDIPGKMYDPLSSLYYLRTKNMKLKDKILTMINADEKNFQVQWEIEKYGRVSLVGFGFYDAFLVKTRIMHNNKLRKDKEIELWMSVDEKRLPLMINIDVPLGYVKAVLRKAEYIR